MRVQVQQVNVPLGYDEATVLQRLSRKVGCPPALLSHPSITRRSLDARPRNPEPVYALTIEVDLALDTLPDSPHISIVSPTESLPDVPVLRQDTESGVGTTPSSPPRPIVVGAGPAGLFAAHQLALAGLRPLLIERGEDAASRAPKVARFWNEGFLDPESNVLYGEGGAGLFSDGKLTARSKERGRIRTFMELLQACGADDSVLIDAEPHVGSDALLRILPCLRERIIAAGGEVRFNTRLESLVIEDGQLRAVVVNGQEIACQHCVLAVGHSARDVYAMLAERGVALQPKPFAVGVRLEIPQLAIDRAQYGHFAGSPLLGAASFRLTRREEHGLRSCYSFCMCPGGKVISCASEPGFLTTNGMSYSKRSLPLGNAAFLVPVGPADYPEQSIPALAGVEFQRQLERKAYAAAGGAYLVPAVRLVDFLARKVGTSLPAGLSCPRSAPVEFRDILPEFITHTLEKTIPAMLKELNGVKLDEAVLYAPETRSSSPLWIARNPEGGQSLNTRGLFPVGEGAGYSGGIVSSALDGMRAAEHLGAARSNHT
jgi:uncharacterized FAD-dependent dehydrogenase